MDDSADAYGAQAAILRALDGLLGPSSESLRGNSAGAVAVLDRWDSDVVGFDAVEQLDELFDDLIDGPVDDPFDVDAACRLFDRYERFDSVVGSWLVAPFHAAAVSGWSAAEAREGLVALERVERSIAAVRAVLVGRVGLDRDSAAMLTRGTGMSQRAAREAVRVAGVVAAVPGVVDRLAAGVVSSSQVGAVAGLSVNDAAELLVVAAGQSDDEFAATVQRFKVEAGGRDRVERQKASRSVRFSDGPEGCVRMTAVLGPLEGAEVRGVLDQVCDALWRRDHPERARVAGGHGGEPRDRRLADALVALVRGARCRFGLAPVGADESGAAGSTSSGSSPGSAGAAGSARSAQSAGWARSAGAGGGGRFTARTASSTSDGTGSHGSCVCGDGTIGARSTPAVIVTVEAETLRTTLLPDTALDVSELPELLARSQLYVAIREGTDPARLVFGRNRRLASKMQRLALAVLQPRCQSPGCDVPAQRCEVHHHVEFDAGGNTDLANLCNYCSAHHHHHHDQAKTTEIAQGSGNSSRPHDRAGRTGRQRRSHQPDDPDPGPSG